MRADEIREMGKDDIVARIRELEEERFRLQFRSATEPLEDPLRLRVIRRDIARMKTIAAQKRAGLPEPEAKAAPAPKAEKTEKKTKTAKPKAAAKPKSRAKTKSKE